MILPIYNEIGRCLKPWFRQSENKQFTQRTNDKLLTLRVFKNVKETFWGKGP